MGNSTVENSYWDKASSGLTTSAAGTGVSSGDNLKKEGEDYVDEGNGNNPVFVGWGFGTNEDNPWEWLGDGNWPILHWVNN